MAQKAGRYGIRADQFDGSPANGKLKTPEVPEVKSLYYHYIDIWLDNTKGWQGHVYFSFIHETPEITTDNVFTIAGEYTIIPLIVQKFKNTLQDTTTSKNYKISAVYGGASKFAVELEALDGGSTSGIEVTATNTKKVTDKAVKLN